MLILLLNGQKGWELNSFFSDDSILDTVKKKHPYTIAVNCVRVLSVERFFFLPAYFLSSCPKTLFNKLLTRAVGLVRIFFSSSATFKNKASKAFSVT